eukprot:1617797-Alexandrium_andersonii.AAC.1
MPPQGTCALALRTLNSCALKWMQAHGPACLGGTRGTRIGISPTCCGWEPLRTRSLPASRIFWSGAGWGLRAVGRPSNWQSCFPSARSGAIRRAG